MAKLRPLGARLASPRARIALAAFCMQLALGAVYGWSVFLNPLREQFAAGKPETNLTFTITLAVLGITAGFGGGLQRRIGPRATATIAGILYGSGLILSGFASNLIAVYLFYGVLGGVGLGLGYIVPLAVLIKWFPDKRGFITGLAVTGFGLGALVTSPLATELIKTYGVQSTLLLLGTAYLAIVVVAAQFLRPAPDNYAPPGWTPVAPDTLRSGVELRLAEALRTPHWYLLWSMLALNVTAGAALISVAAPLAQELTRVDPTVGAIAVCVISLFNGLGRLIWGALSDGLGRARTFMALFLLQALAFAVLPAVDHFALFLVPAAVIALCYGGGFGTMPAFASDVFGAKNAGTIYGAMLTAWSAGAIVGPLFIAGVPYRMALPMIAGMLAAAATMPLIFMVLVQRRALASAGICHCPTDQSRLTGVASPSSTACSLVLQVGLPVHETNSAGHAHHRRRIVGSWRSGVTASEQRSFPALSASMKHLVSLGLAAALALGLNATPAEAGPCSNEIAQIESALRRPGADVGPTGSQTIGAQLHRQPTPGSVERAEERADSRLDAALARARTFDAQDNRTECLKAVEEIRLLIGMQ